MPHSEAQTARSNETQTMRVGYYCWCSQQHAKHNGKHHVLPLPVSKQHVKHDGKHHVLPLPVSKQHVEHDVKHHVLPLPVMSTSHAPRPLHRVNMTLFV